MLKQMLGHQKEKNEKLMPQSISDSSQTSGPPSQQLSFASGNAKFNFYEQGNELDFPDLQYTVFINQKRIALGPANSIREFYYFNPESEHKEYKA